MAQVPVYKDDGTLIGYRHVDAEEPEFSKAEAADIRQSLLLKYDSGKSRPDLLPPEALEEISKVLAFGAQKYEDNNWRKGTKWSRYYGALLRHLIAWRSGKAVDEESGLSTLAHAGCCLLFLLTYEKLGLGEDDRVPLRLENETPKQHESVENIEEAIDYAIEHNQRLHDEAVNRFNLVAERLTAIRVPTSKHPVVLAWVGGMNTLYPQLVSEESRFPHTGFGTAVCAEGDRFDLNKGAQIAMGVALRRLLEGKGPRFSSLVAVDAAKEAATAVIRQRLRHAQRQK